MERNDLVPPDPAGRPAARNPKPQAPAPPPSGLLRKLAVTSFSLSPEEQTTSALSTPSRTPSHAEAFLSSTSTSSALPYLFCESVEKTMDNRRVKQVQLY